MLVSYWTLFTLLGVLCALSGSHVRVSADPIDDVGSNGNHTTATALNITSLDHVTTTNTPTNNTSTPDILPLNRTSNLTKIATRTNDTNILVKDLTLIESVDDRSTIGQKVESLIQNLVDKFRNWLKTVEPNDRTLILSLAVLVGLLLIGCLIGLVICIFNSFQSCMGSKRCQSGATNNKSPIELATNPAYDNTNIKYKPDFDPSVSFSATNDDMYPVNAPLISNQVSNSKMLDAHNSTSSISCSSTSINSVRFKSPDSVQIIKTPKSSDSRPIIPNANNETSTPSKSSKNQNIRSSISNLMAKTKLGSGVDEKNADSENERSYLLDETDRKEDNPNETSVTPRRQPMFQHQVKSSQQLMREQKISKHPSYSRTQSHSECEGSNNRLSAASSRSSIAMPGIPLDFDQIKDDIDDLAVNKEKLASRTNLQATSRNASQANLDNQSDSINNSIADIYIKELINKHQQSTQKQNPIKKLPKANLDMSLSSSSIISETQAGDGSTNRMEVLKKKRMSMNIDVSEVNFNTNPGGGVSTSNLDRNTSASAFTVSSEKSCY